MSNTQRATLERKRQVWRIMPRVERRLRFLEHVEGRGVDLFRAACERDLEGLMGNWSRGTARATRTPQLVLA